MRRSVEQEVSGADEARGVALWGPRGAGKTTYMAVLKQAAEDRGWDVTVAHDENYHGQESPINRNRRALHQGFFPRKTEVDGTPERIAMTLRKGTVTIPIDLIDPPGELFEPSPQQDALRPTRDRVFAHVAQARGMLIVMDVGRPGSEMTEAFRVIREEFDAFIARREHGEAAAKIKPSRIAFVLSMADRIPWLARIRARESTGWLESCAGVEALAASVRKLCPEVGFYFSSSIGWIDGLVSCRVAVVPRMISLDGNLASRNGVEQRDLIPDPLVSPVRSEESARNPIPVRSDLPIFVDPLRLVDQDEIDSRSIPGDAGVLVMPGRNGCHARANTVIRPWNVIEPVLWAAGVDEP